ncbi:hypothetical protein AJ80_08735 [Polytolypa hystricis UAMH7299]|uniref:Uncharacterized protein n=1 Tax=Polytolypa hystricis (strain UAMH7299) TaxID=1447883 RepID=A0A2B7X2Q7_POLH7|nr:hypothetical protein AJ80_08735 [Polytolypa hystricis UAMH7299]
MVFFHKNKSQASLLGFHEARSQDSIISNSYHRPATPRSPPQSSAEPSGNPASHHYSAQHPYNRPQSFAHTGELYDPGYTHPAHAVTSPSYSELPSESAPLPPPHHYTTVSNSHGQRPSSRPALNVVPGPALGSNSDSSAAPDLSSPDQAWTPQSPESPPHLEQQPRKSRRSFFGFKDTSSKVGRNLSVRRKTAVQNTLTKKSPKVQSFDPPLEHENQAIDSRMPHHSKNPSQTRIRDQYPSSRPPPRSSSSNIEVDFIEQRPVQRVNTDPALRSDLYQDRPLPDPYQDPANTRLGNQIAQQNPQFQIDQPNKTTIRQVPGQQLQPIQPSQRHADTPQLDTHHLPRPPSQQSFGPPSPLPPPYQSSEPAQQNNSFRQNLQASAQVASQGGMAGDRQTGLRQPSDSIAPHGQGHDGQIDAQQYPPSLLQHGSSGFKGNLSQQSLAEQGRETPPLPPTKGQDKLSESEVRALMLKLEELQAKYNKVKKYYFEKDAQVQQLQNTVAHQRMSASRTVLDDNEYTTRFSRLDGAINNLAFNIRKDWKNIPPWLLGVVSEDAHIVGTKEMTAVGRACLTRWLVDEIFNRYFHPGVEPNLSRQLKVIEQNVRMLGTSVSDDDKENHLARLSSWRRTTLDGLGEVLNNKLAEDYRVQLTQNLVEKLTASLEMNLKSPPPPGLENGVSMIVELAVGIMANIPLESREISVEYFHPGAQITETYMKVETTLPPLSNPSLDSRLSSEPQSAIERPGQGSMKGLDPNDVSLGELERDSAKDSSSSSTTLSAYGGNHPQAQAPPYQHVQPVKEPRKKSVFGSLISKKPHPSAPPPGPIDTGRPGSSSIRDPKDRDEPEQKEVENRIRFAAFVTVEVRGKGTSNVIVKAPVYTIA